MITQFRSEALVFRAKTLKTKKPDSRWFGGRADLLLGALIKLRRKRTIDAVFETVNQPANPSAYLRAGPSGSNTDPNYIPCSFGNGVTDRQSDRVYFWGCPTDC